VKRFQQPGALRVRQSGTTSSGSSSSAGVSPAAGSGQVTSGGYPVLASATVPPELEPLARRTVASCPRLALLIEPAEPGRAG
jgi:hypothetical protein